jgi:hypothetical protein
MEKIAFPLRFSKSQWPPLKGACGLCGGPIANVVVYMNAGATADALKSSIVDQQTFWSCGIHTSTPDTSTDLRVVELPDHDQFDLSFCSTTCLRRFMNAVVDELETQGSLRGRRGKT